MPDCTSCKYVRNIEAAGGGEGVPPADRQGQDSHATFRRMRFGINYAP